ncbi:Uncharacterised protein [Chlamydia trachomatis]|nr:Uncharacterised protein [Chlamydia trachomatis]
MRESSDIFVLSCRSASADIGGAVCEKWGELVEKPTESVEEFGFRQCHVDAEPTGESRSELAAVADGDPRACGDVLEIGGSLEIVACVDPQQVCAVRI